MIKMGDDPLDLSVTSREREKRHGVHSAASIDPTSMRFQRLHTCNMYTLRGKLWL